MKGKAAVHEVIEDPRTTIPELEEIAATYRLNEWSAREKEIIQMYYNRVPFRDLMRFLPNKTDDAVRNMAARLGITKPKRSAA